MKEFKVFVFKQIKNVGLYGATNGISIKGVLNNIKHTLLYEYNSNVEFNKQAIKVLDLTANELLIPITKAKPHKKTLSIQF